MTTEELFREIKDLEEEAQELINCGNSREKAEGQGMKKVIDYIYEIIDEL